MLIRRDRAMTAVSLMLDIAFHAGRLGTVSAGDIAERLGLARRGMEPLLQTLSRAGLLDSVRGPRGGYRIGRPHRDIRLAEIIAVAVSADDDAQHGPEGRLQTAVIDRVWRDLDDAVKGKLQSITLDDLLHRAAAAGLRRPEPTPITFAI